MENLFPTNELEITAEDIRGEDGPVGYMDSVYFDETIGDFSRDGQLKLKTATGLEAWEQWCINCLLTERGAYPAYGGAFGVATKEAFMADSMEEVENILTLEITEGLMNDPYGRTESVDEIKFNWIDTSQLEVVVTVTGIDDVTLDITALLDERSR